MTTNFELLPERADKSEGNDTTRAGDGALGLASASLHYFKDAIAAQTSHSMLSEFLPSLSIFERNAHKESNESSNNIADPKEARKLLYGDFSKATDAITADACVQPSGIGNCYFVAAMASLAKVHPEAIKNMITVNDNGTYTVKFPGASEAITVNQPTKEEMDSVGGNTKYGVWPVVLMKAYGKYCGGGKHDIDGSDGGSAFSAGVKILTDKGVVNYGIGYMIPLQSWSGLNEELRDALSTANPSDRLPVTVSTSKSPFSDSTKDGFVRGHVYSVLAYEPNVNDIKQSKVTVRNPWGGPDATKVITLQEFSDNFMQLSIPRR